VIRAPPNFVYVNCGDWIESCTAVIEHFDGVLEIIKWTQGERPDQVMPATVLDSQAVPKLPDIAVAARFAMFQRWRSG
jgi:hypothetical protein